MNPLSRWLAAFVLCLATGLACAEHANAQVLVGIVGWPLDPSDSLRALASETEKCLTTTIRDAAPEVSVVPQRTIRDALFPLLEPATQPRDEAAFAAMLARDDVRARLAARGLRYLVAFAGGTRKDEWAGSILCGAGMGGGGCLGFMWRGERTVLDAALWSLDGSAVVRREAATTEGASIMPAFVLPIPLLARTQAEACHELGMRLAGAIRASASERAATPAQPAGPRD
jgi:hypothetical protein